MISGIILSSVALLANVIGLAIPYWLYRNVAGIKISIGLWEVCTNDQCASIYGHLPVPDALKATQAMEIVGMILITMALLCGILKRSVMRSQTKLPQAAGFFAICAGVAMIVGTIIYAAKVKKTSDPADILHYHAGFGLCISAGILAIIAGVMFITIGRGSGSYREI